MRVRERTERSELSEGQTQNEMDEEGKDRTRLYCSLCLCAFVSESRFFRNKYIYIERGRQTEEVIVNGDIGMGERPCGE